MAPTGQERRLPDRDFMMNEEKQYLELFRVSRPELEKLMTEALAAGADYADIYFECTNYTNLLLKDSRVTSGGYHEDFGAGVRVLCGERTGYSYCETTEWRDMEAAVKSASAICAAGGVSRRPESGGRAINVRNAAGAGKRFNEAAVEGTGKELYGMIESWEKCSRRKMTETLKMIETEIRRREARVVKVIARISDSVSRVMMYNSLGELTFETRPMGSVSVSAVFSGHGPDGKPMNITKSDSRSFRTGAEMLSENLVRELADGVLRNIDARFEAVRPKGGKMPVVMGAGASGILLHEAMGHAFEADFNRKGQSIFSDRMGQRICAGGISIVDDGTIRGNRGACAFDDEGVPGQKTYMVEDGVLTGYLHDRISAAWYGVAPTGNGRRENFRFNPIPRMRATYMENGDCDAADIVASVKKGIYVDEFSNGQVQIGEGDFTFYVNSGFLIEDGRLTAPVKDINVIGNGPQALADITMVGNDLKISNGTWTCGKDQSVPVSVGIPTVLIKSLTVGGE